MKIIIVGAGKVGQNLAAALSQEENEVTLLDHNLAVLEGAGDSMDISCIQGKGTSMTSLIEAGIREADLVIAVTSSDEVNMLCCLTAKRMGVEHTVARIRDPEYSKELVALKRELGLDMIINPEDQTAREIARILQFPAAISVDPFAGGRVEMVAYRVTAEDPMVGIPLHRAMARISEEVLFCIILRGEEVIIPRGQTTLEAGDVAYLIGKSSQILSFFRSIRRKTSRVRNTLLVGGGRIAYYLCEAIQGSNIRVKLIEMDEKKCLEIEEHFPSCTVIRGDGTDVHLLETENIRESESIVLLTGNDEENVITGLYANHAGVNKVIVKINRGGYEELLKELRLDCVVSTKNITSEQIIRYVRAMGNSIGGGMEMLYSIVGGRAEALQFAVTAETPHTGQPLKTVPFKMDVLIAVVVRGSRVIIPSGEDSLLVGDSVILVTCHRGIHELSDVFERGGR